VTFRRRRSAAPEESTEEPSEPDEVLAPSIGAPDQQAEPDLSEPDFTESESAVSDAEEARKRPRLSERLGRTKSAIAGPFARIRARSRIDESSFEDLEEALLVADVGLESTTRILEELRSGIRERRIKSDSDSLVTALRDEIAGSFSGEDRSLSMGSTRPTVWLFVGVNGVGKTTTIGKVARQLIDEGNSVVLAAGDTFRAAAGEQLETWSERSGATLVRGADGADPSSVIYDAVESARARGADLVLADSAGRLHTKSNLMDELKKVRRVADRPPGQVSEVLLVLDATTGQNGLAQAREFTSAVGVTGIILTKLDGTAKGGIVLAIHESLGIPIKLVGVGEGIEDLVPFDPLEFAAALVGGDSPS